MDPLFALGLVGITLGSTVILAWLYFHLVDFGREMVRILKGMWDA